MSTRTPVRRLPADQRREQLLHAAARVLGTGGYPALTMEAIALRAGVSKPVVYSAFSNREDAMAALLQRESEQIIGDLLEVIRPPAGGVADLAALVAGGLDRVLELVRRDPHRYRLILLHVDGTPPLVRHAIIAGRRTIITNVQTALIDHGLPADTDLELVATMLVGLGEHAATLMLTAPNEFAPERFHRAVTRILGGT